MTERAGQADFSYDTFFLFWSLRRQFGHPFDFRAGWADFSLTRYYLLEAHPAEKIVKENTAAQ
jgi:hypothetical protein